MKKTGPKPATKQIDNTYTVYIGAGARPEQQVAKRHSIGEALRTLGEYDVHRRLVEVGQLQIVREDGQGGRRVVGRIDLDHEVLGRGTS